MADAARAAEQRRHARAPARAAAPHEAALWCERIGAQNDVEGIFGVVTHGSPTKPPPRELGARFEAAEFLDAVKHDPSRAESWSIRSGTPSQA